MTARATLEMTETELTRRHCVRTVTHINTLLRRGLKVRDFSSDTHCNNVSVAFQHLYFHTRPPSSLRVRPTLQHAQTPVGVFPSTV